MNDIAIDFTKADTCIRPERLYSAFLSKRGPDFYFPGESHDFWELVYVTDGTAGVMAGSSIYELHAGDVILHKPYEFHRIWSAGRTGTSYMVISFELSGEKAHELDGLMFRASQRELPQLTSLAEQIEASRKQKGNELFCCATDPVSLTRFTFTLGLLLTDCISRASSGTGITGKSSLAFNRAVSYMEKNPSLNPLISELAEQADVSVSTLKRVFREYSGLGVHHYMTKLKMSEARKLLKNGASVCETASALGFSGQNNFSAAFRKAVGVSPSEYKNSTL